MNKQTKKKNYPLTWEILFSTRSCTIFYRFRYFLFVFFVSSFFLRVYLWQVQNCLSLVYFSFTSFFRISFSSSSFLLLVFLLNSILVFQFHTHFFYFIKLYIWYFYFTYKRKNKYRMNTIIMSKLTDTFEHFILRVVHRTLYYFIWGIFYDLIKFLHLTLTNEKCTPKNLCVIKIDWNTYAPIWIR